MWWECAAAKQVIRRFAAPAAASLKTPSTLLTEYKYELSSLRIQHCCHAVCTPHFLATFSVFVYHWSAHDRRRTTLWWLWYGSSGLWYGLWTRHGIHATTTTPTAAVWLLRSATTSDGLLPWYVLRLIVIFALTCGLASPTWFNYYLLSTLRWGCLPRTDCYYFFSVNIYHAAFFPSCVHSIFFTHNSKLSGIMIYCLFHSKVHTTKEQKL